MSAPKYRRDPQEDTPRPLHEPLMRLHEQIMPVSVYTVPARDYAYTRIVCSQPGESGGTDMGHIIGAQAYIAPLAKGSLCGVPQGTLRAIRREFSASGYSVSDFPLYPDAKRDAPKKHRKTVRTIDEALG